MTMVGLRSASKRDTSEKALEHWKRQKRFFVQVLAQFREARYYGLPQLEAWGFLASLLLDQDGWHSHAERYTARILSSLTYGSVDMIEERHHQAKTLIVSAGPTTELQNMIPPLKYLPEWLSPWKQREKLRDQTERELFQRGFDDAKAKMECSELRPSVARFYFEQKEQFGFQSDLEGMYVLGFFDTVVSLKFPRIPNGLALTSII